MNISGLTEKQDKTCCTNKFMNLNIHAGPCSHHACFVKTKNHEYIFMNIHAGPFNNHACFMNTHSWLQFPSWINSWIWPFMQVHLTIMHVSLMNFNFIHAYTLMKFMNKCTKRQRKLLKHFFFSYIYNNRQQKVHHHTAIIE